MSLYWKWRKDKENIGKEGRKKDTGTDLGIAESKIKSKARHLRKSVKIRGKAEKTVGLAKIDTVKSSSVTGSANKRKHSKEPDRVTGGIKSIPRRVVSLVLVLVTLTSVLIMGVSGVSADSNSRIATYIKLAAGNEITDGDVNTMTEDQLRFLGLYLSNFYIPFVTEIGTNNDETTNNIKDDMVKSLQQKLAFSEDLSKSLVETVFGYTRSSLTQIKVAAKINLGSEKYKYHGLRDDVDYYELFEMCSGKYPYDVWLNINKNIFRTYYYSWLLGEAGRVTLDAEDGHIVAGSKDDDYVLKDSNKKFPKEVIDSMLDQQEMDKTEGNIQEAIENYIILYAISSTVDNAGQELVFYYGDLNNPKVVGNVYVGELAKFGGRHTPFQQAFWKCMEATNRVKLGYGIAAWDFNTGDGELSAINKLAKDKKLTEEEAAKMFMPLTPIYVDCFGDIIRVGVNHQTVIMPGSINPFSWVEVSDTGEDKSPAGVRFNTINSICINQAHVSSSGDVNELFHSVSEVKEGDGLITGKLSFNAINSDLDGAATDRNWIDSGGKLKMKIIQGTSETDISQNFVEFWRLTRDGADSIGTSGYHYYSSKWNDWHDEIQAITVTCPLKDNEFYISVLNDTKCLCNIVIPDNLGTYKSKEDKEYTALNVASFFNSSGGIGSESEAIKLKSNVSFGSLYSSIADGRLDIPVQASEQALTSLYITYCWACLYDNDNKKDTIGKLRYRFNLEGMPDMSNSPITLDDSVLGSIADAEEEAIRHWTYYLLHPTKGFEYVRRLITNKVNHLLLGWHSDMVGTNGVGATVGTTKYRSNMGYVTMPDLSEINWTNKLIQIYNDCIPFFIIALIIIMLFAFIVGALNLQHAALGVLIFAVFTLLPVNLINGVVGYSNRISQNAYGDKFTYWALVQQESYSQAIDKAANSEGSSGTSTYENYLRTLYAENEKVYSNQGSESIMLKWQAPKKMASMVLTEADGKTMSGLNDLGVKMLNNMLNRAYSGQSYTDDEDAVYMYRSYVDLSNFSRYIYNGIKEKTVKRCTGLYANNSQEGWTSMPVSADLAISKVNMGHYMDDGYTYGVNGASSQGYNKVDDNWYLWVHSTSGMINDALKQDLSKLNTSKDLVDINSDVFNFGLPQFNAKTFTNRWSVETFAATGGFQDNSTRKDALSTYMQNYKEEDFVGLAAYGLYSENPYYYFSWKLYNDGLKSNSSLGAQTGYKDLLLGEEEGGYFYNVKGNKELKDFMNMKGLFTYVIPYMKQCNDMVREWDDTYGIFVYDGIPTEEGHWDDMTTDEMKQKYWHNLNVTRLYCLYCPWVDVMYDCSYSKAETINVMGRRVTIDDPIDPQKYPQDRPMIFSASEMSDYGLNEADLTSVEKKILRCNEQFEDRMYELLNYYKFSDPTLNSAAAINCAFVFNNTFSENGIFTENHNIYPQSFDLSNFSYDAFLRLILANATGENLIDASTTEDSGMATGDLSGDFYERLVNRSSTITVIIMLILDVLSVYLIPAFRIFFLVAIFLASIFIVLTSAFRIESSAKFIRKVGTQFFLPLIAFFLTTIAFSLIVGLFIGEGNNKVTETGLSISLGDPVVTMLVMIALDLILLFVYWKIIKKVLTDIRGHAKAVGSFIGGVGSAAVGFVAGAVAAGAGSAQDRARGVSGRYKAWKTNRALKGNAANGGKGSIEEQAQNGTGIENGRASERGAGGYAEYAEDAARNRDLEKDKGKTPDIERGVDAEERKAEIDSKAESGDIEGSGSDGIKSHRSYDTVGSNTDSESADSVNNKASSGANTDSTGGITSNRAPREKVKRGYKPDSYDREEARRKGIPSNKGEGSNAINQSVGERDRVPHINGGGNRRATDRGRKPVETQPNREKVSKSKKDPKIHGNK